MTDAALVDVLAQYRAGLDAEIALLERLESIATRQHAMMTARDFDQFARESDERDRLTRALVAVEDGLQPVRASLSQFRTSARALPGYADVVERRDRAAALVTRILATDEGSLHSLADAELARRAAVASLEQSETTLDAYRRVLAPAPTHPALVDRHG